MCANRACSTILGTVVLLICATPRVTLADPTDAEKAYAEAAKASVKAAEASGKVAVAQVKQEAAEKEKNAAEAQLNEAKAGKLIRYGVSAGAAVVGMSRSPAEGTGGASQRSFEITTMPYAILAPAYWFYSDLSATYCASYYVDADRNAANKAAIARARDRAKLEASPEAQKNLDSEDPEKKTQAENAIYSRANEIWDPKRVAPCWPTRIGLWIGKPTSYNASVVPAKDAPEVSREVQSPFSFGLGFLPNAYVTILAGLSFARITDSAVAATATTSGQPARTLRFTTITFGIGGNLDFLSSIF